MPPLDPLDPMRPSEDELCVALMFGQDPRLPVLDLAAGRANAPRPLIERHLQVAMQRGPVGIAFSGGRDSSALLAIAALVARREGLELPLAVTAVFPSLPESDEEEWQRLVLDHLGLADRWVRVVDPDFDLIGEPARRMHGWFGQLLPPNSHAFLPMMEALGEGATIVSGGGGDEVLEGRPQRLSSALRSRRKLAPDERVEALIGDLPAALQRRAIRRHGFISALDWVRPAARQRLLVREAQDRGAIPVRYDRLLARAATDRHFQSAHYALQLAAGELGTRVLFPFNEHDVIAAQARLWGGRFPGNRLRSLRPLVGDLLPETILTRTSKAEFVGAFVGERSQAFIADWDGSGVDPERVDVDALRRAWNDPAGPHYCSQPLLQRAALS